MKIVEILKNEKEFSRKWKNSWAGSRGLFCLGGLFLCLCLCTTLVQAQPLSICGYSDPEFSIYNRLLKVDVNRGGQKVGEVHFSYQFNGYFVRCVTGGVSSKRFFPRARDARWAACNSCY